MKASAFWNFGIFLPDTLLLDNISEASLLILEVGSILDMEYSLVILFSFKLESSGRQSFRAYIVYLFAKNLSVCY